MANSTKSMVSVCVLILTASGGAMTVDDESIEEVGRVPVCMAIKGLKLARTQSHQIYLFAYSQHWLAVAGVHQLCSIVASAG